MASFEVVPRSDEPARYGELFLSLDVEEREGDPLYGEFGRSYYPAVFGDDWCDKSFAVVGSQGDVVVLECGSLAGQLSRFGMPIRVQAARSHLVSNGLVKAAIRHVVELADRAGADRALIADPASSGSLSELGVVCLANDGRLETRLHATVDLSRDVPSIRGAVRSRFRSHVNWGERSLMLEYCNGENPDPSLFVVYERLHAEAAGRRTRADDSWSAMFEAITRGIAELSIATLEQDPVGAVLVVDGSTTSYYASAAFVRERFEHPLGHWPMMNAILRARERGRRKFDVGEVPFRADASDKEHSIGFFKRGFAERLEMRPVWTFECGGR